MKRVSFKIAKILNEAGYPQKWYDTEYYYDVIGELKRHDDYEGNNIEDIMYYQRLAIPAPTYIEVWLWLWREKKICFFNVGNCNNKAKLDIVLDGVYQHTTTSHSDPEEATIEAIEYLVENDLIK